MYLISVLKCFKIVGIVTTVYFAVTQEHTISLANALIVNDFYHCKYLLS